MGIFRRIFSANRTDEPQTAMDGLQEALHAGWQPEALLKSLMEGAGPLDTEGGSVAVTGREVPGTDWLSRFYAHQSC